MTNADLVAKLEAALHLLQEVESGMDDRSDLADLQAVLSTDLKPALGRMVDEIHYSRPEPGAMGPG